MQHNLSGNHPIHRKRRTREHIIADLSANFVERCALQCGYSVERVYHDYGIDLLLFTYNEAGEVENGTVLLQLKASDAVAVLADQETIAFPVSHADLKHWLEELYPCILIIYDAQSDEAFWLYIQAYFQKLEGFDLDDAGDTFTVHVRRANRVSPDAIRHFADLKAHVIQQAKRPEIQYGD